MVLVWKRAACVPSFSLRDWKREVQASIKFPLRDKRSSVSWLRFCASFLMFIVQQFKAYNQVCWVRNTFQPIPIAVGQPRREGLVGKQRSAEEMEQGTDSSWLVPEALSFLLKCLFLAHAYYGTDISQKVMWLLFEGSSFC